MDFMKLTYQLKMSRSPLEKRVTLFFRLMSNLAEKVSLIFFSQDVVSAVVDQADIRFSGYDIKGTPEISGEKQIKASGAKCVFK